MARWRANIAYKCVDVGMECGSSLMSLFKTDGEGLIVGSEYFVGVGTEFLIGRGEYWKMELFSLEGIEQEETGEFGGRIVERLVFQYHNFQRPHAIFDNYGLIG